MELLVVAQDRPVDDSPGKWKRGDVVLVKPDGWEWAKEERNPAKFTIIKLPGIAAINMVEDLLEHEDEDDPLFGDRTLRARRKRRLSEALLVKAERGDRLKISDVVSAKEDRPLPPREVRGSRA